MENIKKLWPGLFASDFLCSHKCQKDMRKGWWEEEYLLLEAQTLSSPPPWANLTPQSSCFLTSPDHAPSCLPTLPYALSHIQDTLLLCPPPSLPSLQVWRTMFHWSPLIEQSPLPSTVPLVVTRTLGGGCPVHSGWVSWGSASYGIFWKAILLASREQAPDSGQCDAHSPASWPTGHLLQCL